MAHFKIVSAISTHGIIVCFFLFQAIYYIAQFLLFWDSYTQLILLYVFQFQAIYYITQFLLFWDSYTAGIIVS